MVARPLEVVSDLEHGHELAQVAGDGLLCRNEDGRLVLYL